MVTTAIEKEVSVYETGFMLNADICTDKVLADFITRRNKRSLKDLKGKIAFRDDYDYKSMRH